MTQKLELTPHESVTVRESEPGKLVVEVEYAPEAKPPPKHFHPEQDESFEVTAGRLAVELGDERRQLEAGEVVEIPRGTTHRMWNPGAETTRAVWTTSPAGRTESWFRELSDLRASGRVGSDGMPGPLAFAVLLTEYRDVFRLAGPQPLILGAFAALAPVGRARGYRPAHAPRWG